MLHVTNSLKYVWLNLLYIEKLKVQGISIQLTDEASLHILQFADDKIVLANDKEEWGLEIESEKISASKEYKCRGIAQELLIKK